jgi:hypothetical protein
MRIRTTCNLAFQMGDPTPLILMLRPRSGAQQWVASEAYTLTPSVPVEEYTDIFGNLCQRLAAPAGWFHVHTLADVSIYHQFGPPAIFSSMDVRVELLDGLPG